MLSISAVAAVDTNSTDDILAGEVDEEPPSGSANSISVDGDTLTANSNPSYVLNGSNVKTYYSGYNYNVVLTKNNTPVKGASVSFNLNGVNYTKTTDANGKAVVPLNLNEGSYKITASYEDAVYSGTIKVVSTIKANDLTKVYKYTL